MVPVADVSEREVAKLLSLEEGHFAELKSLDIAAAKLTRSLSAYANAEGGTREYDQHYKEVPTKRPYRAHDASPFPTIRPRRSTAKTPRVTSAINNDSSKATGTSDHPNSSSACGSGAPNQAIT